MHGRCLLLVLAFLVAPLWSQSKDDWAPLRFLIGDWVGEGGGDPGKGSGYFSFQPDLQKKIVVRKNHAEYPATKDRPAFSHDDLTIIYRESTGELRAVYFDNEGHVIHYDVTAPETNTAVFLSAASQPGPQFRLIYELKDHTMQGRFQLRMPGQTEFKSYLEWSGEKK